MNMWKCLRK